MENLISKGERYLKMDSRTFWLPIASNEFWNYLDSNILITTATSDQLREWVWSHSFQNTWELFWKLKHTKHRSNRTEKLCKEGVLKKHSKIHRRRSLPESFFNKVATATSLKRDSGTSAFLCILGNL